MGLWTRFCCKHYGNKQLANTTFSSALFLHQHLKDKFWNFIFYKFIFIFGVLNVQTVEEVVMWCLWFSALVFLHLMVQLCKDRFEYVSIIFSLSFLPGIQQFYFLKLWNGLLYSFRVYYANTCCTLQAFSTKSCNCPALNSIWR